MNDVTGISKNIDLIQPANETLEWARIEHS